MGSNHHAFQRRLLGGVAALVVMVSAGAAWAQERPINIAPQSLSSALYQFGSQSGQQVIFTPALAAAKRTRGVTRTGDVETSLAQLLRDTGLTYQRTPDAFMIVKVSTDPQSPSAGDGAEGTAVEALIVTAQKKEENIQDVPIAVSLFSAKTLDQQKIEGGAELLRGTPNVSFTKTNFASYNFSIRGIGTQALSVTTDPAVAVSFNSSPMIRNRLFEQEYFDVNRIEVLRGPQGTLYGRNATAGVVNMIPNLASPDDFRANVKLEAGNFSSKRVSGMINAPLGETLAVRIAGAWTQRDGFDYNTVNSKRVNGRDLWGGRASITWKPTDTFSANLIWDHFEENDDRSRTGKQLCHRDASPESIGGAPIRAQNGGFFSQGCHGGSLYDDAAYGVPNGASLPNVIAASGGPGAALGFNQDYGGIFVIPYATDPFSAVVQSRNLREIATTYDPVFRAKNDVAQFNADLDLGGGLKLVSQTLYTRDNYYSTQDYSRFQSIPIFPDTSLPGVYQLGPDGLIPAYALTPGGVFCDPQLGCSKGYLAVDLNRSKSRQWSQEFRLQSAFDGPLNFSLGVNYLDFKIDEDYFMFNNILTLIGINLYNRASGPGSAPQPCAPGQTQPPPIGGSTCVYIDPNPIGSIDGEGHNYFRSRNVAKTQSKAIFGELYWQATDTLKLTMGLRYTRDTKITTPYPSQLLLTPGYFGGGYTNSGYPALPDIKQNWGEFTGRFVVDWKPQVSFTDDTLVYASYSRGYKAGGTNSPGIGSDPRYLGFFARDPRFRPEFVNAFEVGAKNSLAQGKLQLNATAFFYDYKDYQVSQIQDRATLNENFDARTWGLELETIWEPVRDLRINANLGLLGTRIGKGMKSIDVMDRTQGHDDWVIVKPWLQQASNCIAPKALVAQYMAFIYNGDFPYDVDLGITGFCPFPSQIIGAGFRPGDIRSGWGGVVYDPLTYADVGQNQGQGFAADLSGNELPNAPHWTFNIGAQYTFRFDDWNLTMRGDYYRQAASWARVYNSEIDRMKGWGNANLSLTLERPAANLTAQLYVKNLFDDAPITGAFTNSDDSGLTTNVFTLDPRIIGFSIAKGF